MLEKYIFPYIRKWCMVGGLCLAFPWVAFAQQQKISLNIETGNGANKGTSVCKCGI